MKALNAIIVGALPLVPRAVVRRIASRYVAGETLDDALRCVAGLQSQGSMATVDVLGEDITRLEETEETVVDYQQALEAIASRRLDANISVKLTALGLKIDPEVCRRQFRRILEAAQARGTFVRIDMEDSSVTEETIRIYEEVHQRFANVGIVLQAYLRRTLDDARRVARIRANVRICKGIYVEPPEVAFQGRQEIRENFLAALELLLSEKCYVGIATHDPPLIDGTLASVARRGLSRGDYEFQMLLGVAVEARRRLVAAGQRLRVYVPYGGSWYAYSVRRLKENPAIAGNVMKGLLAGLTTREP